MLIFGVLLLWQMPTAISVLLWINLILGAMFAVSALINLLGTDRSHEVYEARNDGYQLNSADIAQLHAYDKRAIAFVFHILLLLLLGLAGWFVAHRFIPIPSE